MTAMTSYRNRCLFLLHSYWQINTVAVAHTAVIPHTAVVKNVSEVLMKLIAVYCRARIVITTQVTPIRKYWWQTLQYAGIVLCIRPTNERRRYIVTSSPIDWKHTKMIPEYCRYKLCNISRVHICCRIGPTVSKWVCLMYSLHSFYTTEQRKQIATGGKEISQHMTWMWVRGICLWYNWSREIHFQIQIQTLSIALKLTSTSAAALPRCLSNFRAIGAL